MEIRDYKHEIKQIGDQGQYFPDLLVGVNNETRCWLCGYCCYRCYCCYCGYCFVSRTARSDIAWERLSLLTLKVRLPLMMNMYWP